MIERGFYAQPLFSLGDGGSGLRRVTGIGMRSDYVTSDFAKQGIGVAVWCYVTPKRFDHCRFEDLCSGVYVGNANGVSDHNEYVNVALPTRHVGGGSPILGMSGQRHAWDHCRPLAFDSPDYFFHEDETLERATRRQPTRSRRAVT